MRLHLLVLMAAGIAPAAIAAQGPPPERRDTVTVTV